MSRLVDIHAEAVGTVEHQRQPVDGDPRCDDFVALRNDQRTRIVGTVARHVDHAAQSAEARRREQRLCEHQRTADRGARGAAIRRAGNLAGERVGGFRPLNRPPRHDDLLILRARPFEIGHRDLAMVAGADRGHEFARGDGLDIAFALDLLLLRVHRIGHVHREHELGVDRNGGGFEPAEDATARQDQSLQAIPQQTQRRLRSSRTESACVPPIP